MVKGFHARREFQRLARFGANILDAHSCFIFLPRTLTALLERETKLGGSRSASISSGSFEAEQLAGFVSSSNFASGDGRYLNESRHAVRSGSSTEYSTGHTSSGTSAGHENASDELVLLGAHSLSQKYIPDCVVHAESGLIGWVARHGHPIHVSPFEHDSRTLGTYSEDQQLKSFIAVPLAVPLLNSGEFYSSSASGSSVLNGVLAADSKKAFAFSKLQGKLLEELSEQASSLIVTAISALLAEREIVTLSTFLERAQRYSQMLGADSVEALRITPTNMISLERDLGLVRVDGMLKQLYRLFEQSLPPHTPVYVTPNGELLCLVDNMMSSYFEGKAQALAEHVSTHMGSNIAGSSIEGSNIISSGKKIALKFQRSGSEYANSSSGARSLGGGRSVTELLAATLDSNRAESKGEINSVIPFSRFLRKVV